MNNRLYLAGIGDTVFFTDAGNPERIDSFANSIEIPSGSGDAVTGMVSAFGGIYVFKPNGVWRIDDLGGNNHQFTQVSPIGAVSPKSIITYTNPDTGSNFIFFWSRYGPYVFDGSAARYVGAPLEESSYTGSDIPEYNWLNPSSVVVGHNSVSRELICSYAPIRTNAAGVSVALDRNGEAMVFNYRTKSWYRYVGMICTNALALNFTGQLTELDPVTNLFTSNSYRLLLGGANGRIYTYATAKRDGVPSGLVITADQKYPITTSIAINGWVIPSFPFTHAVDGCWLTILHEASGEWVSAPIILIEPGPSFNVYVQAEWLVTDPGYQALFDVGGGDLTGCVVYLCQPPMRIEFPFDEMDIPFLHKEVVEMATWHRGAFKYRTRDNYLPLVAALKQWKPLADGQGQRLRTQIGRKIESMKLEIASHELDTSIDSYSYLINYEEGASTPQR